MSALAGLALSHFTRVPFTSVYSVPQDSKPSEKPRGLWVSVDGADDWPSWCRSEEYGDIDHAHQLRVVLVADARVLHLASVADIDAFTDEYRASQLTSWTIDWARVARSYRGIIVAPYQWDRRFDGAAAWYYGWDCASGCIWDAAAIASVHELAGADS